MILFYSDVLLCCTDMPFGIRSSDSKVSVGIDIDYSALRTVDEFCFFVNMFRLRLYFD